jgi:hypothetical protein
LMKLVAAVGDGHTALSPFYRPELAFHAVAARMYRFSDGATCGPPLSIATSWGAGRRRDRRSGGRSLRRVARPFPVATRDESGGASTSAFPKS